MGFAETLKNLKKGQGGNAAMHPANMSTEQVIFNDKVREMMEKITAIHIEYGIDVVPILNQTPQTIEASVVFIPQKNEKGAAYGKVEGLVPHMKARE